MASSLLELLAGWLPHQRWYPRKGSAGTGARPSITGSLELPSADPSVTFLILVVTVAGPANSGSAIEHDAGPGLTLQVPLSFYRNDTVELSGAGAGAGAGAGPEQPLDGLLGELPARDGWPAGRVYDGLRDPAFLRLWLAETASSSEVFGSGHPGPPSGNSIEPLHAWRNPAVEGLAGAAIAGIRVLNAEQSNSSVMFRLGEKPLIAKFFRVLHAGAHPEVEIGRALAAVPGQTQATSVPALQAAVGYGDAGTTLFVVHDFVADARDGWVLALAAAGQAADFTAHARAIGTALSNVHHSLASSLGVHQAEKNEAAAFVEAIATRLEWAWVLARPAVGPYDEAFRNVLARLNKINTAQQLQRIHGDLHLGQLLHRDAAGGHEWFVLDFEGEPLRPLAQRGRPDVTLRDLVGMLRSFDYAGAQAAADGVVTKEQGADWAKSSADAFLEGYEEASGEKIARHSALFVALWLDKALYEVVYELQNRPSWAWVPVEAVQNLFESNESGVAWD